jgi:hypothetical protein
MAKRSKKGLSKSAAIRDFRKDNPNAKPKEIAENLNKAGHKVTPGYVSTILSTDRKKGKGKRGRRRIAATRGVRSVAAGPLQNLLAVKRLVSEVGGVEAAQEAISQYSKLMA